MGLSSDQPWGGQEKIDPVGEASPDARGECVLWGFPTRPGLPACLGRFSPGRAERREPRLRYRPGRPALLDGCNGAGAYGCVSCSFSSSLQLSRQALSVYLGPQAEKPLGAGPGLQRTLVSAHEEPRVQTPIQSSSFPGVRMETNVAREGFKAEMMLTGSPNGLTTVYARVRVCVHTCVRACARV